MRVIKVLYRFKYAAIAFLVVVGMGTLNTTTASADSTSQPTQYLATLSGGNLYVKQNVNDPWTLEATGATNMQVAGTTIVFVDESGYLWAKSGINGVWYREAGGVDQYLVTPDLLVIREGWGVWAKSGVTDQWTYETSGAQTVQAAGDNILYTNGSNQYWTKNGINNSWIDETSGGSQYVLTPDLLVLQEGGDVYAKTATSNSNLQNSWTTETTGASSVQAAGNNITRLHMQFQTTYYSSSMVIMDHYLINKHSQTRIQKDNGTQKRKMQAT